MSGSDSAQVLSQDGVSGTVGARPSMSLPPGVKGRYVPILSKAEAGAWDADHSDSLYEHSGVFALNVDDRKAFAIQVSGNSMEPALSNGDLVVCSPAAVLSNGDAAVIRTHSDLVYIKFWNKKADRVILESANKDFKPIELPLSEVAGAWAVVNRVAAGKIIKQL